MRLLQCTLVVFCLVSLVFGRSTQASATNKIDDEEQQPQDESRKASSYLGDIKFLYKTYQECAAADLSTCLKLKLFTIIDRVSRSTNDFKVYEGVSFVQEGEEPVDKAPVKTEKEIEASLPRSLDDKESTLNSLIMDKIMSFFGSHTLKIKFPTSEEMQRSMEQARQKGGLGGGGGGGGGGGKDKKNGHYIMIPLLLGSTLIPLAFGALALLAGKALIVSKLALALASIIGIKKLISGSGHHHESAHEVVVSGGGHGGGWGRNYLTAAHNLAYNGYNQPAQA